MKHSTASLAVILFIFLFSFSLSGQPLKPVCQNDSVWFYSMEFLSAEKGYISGTCFTSYTDYFIYTDDGGETWDFNPAAALPRHMQMLSEDLGYAGGQDGGFWRLSTPPNDWEFLGFINQPVDIFTVHFLDSLNGFVDYAYTENGASTWEFTSYSMLDYHFFNESEALAVDFDHIYKSYDGGMTWEVKADLDQYGPASFEDIHFVNEDFGLVCGNWLLGRTLDGGESWDLDLDFLVQNYTVHKLMSFGPDLLFAVASDHDDYGMLLQSTDQGGSWQMIDFKDDIRDCRKVNDTLAYVISVNGILYELDVSNAPFEQISPGLIESEPVFEHDRYSGIFRDLFAMDHESNDLFYSSTTMSNSVVFMDTVLTGLTGNTGYTSGISGDGQRLWTSGYTSGWLFAKEMLFDENMLLCMGWYNGNLLVGDSSYSSANDNAYIIAYSPGGELLWSNVSGFPERVMPGSLAVGNNGDVYLSAMIENQPELKGDHDHTLGLLRYSRATGELVSMQEVLGFSDNSPWMDERKFPLCFNENGEIYMAGIFDDSLTIGGQTIYSHGDADFVVFKLDTEGDPEWLLHGGGTGEDDLTDIESGTEGAIIGGTSSSYLLNFGDEEIEIDSTEQMFVSKISDDGQVEWFEHSEENVHEASLSFIDLIVDSDDTIWGLGTFYGKVRFGEDSLIAANPRDYYLIKAGHDGGLGAFGQVPNVFYQPSGSLLGTGTSLYLAGKTGSYGLFPDDTIGENKIYVREINNDFVSVPEQAHQDKIAVHIFPNPNDGNFIARVPGSGDCLLEIYDLRGVKVFSRVYQNKGTGFNVRTSHLNPGIYVMRIIDEKRVKTGKMLIY